MSIIISARYVKRPRATIRCDECGKRITAHIRLYGMSNFGNRPETLRLCAFHLDHQQDAKIQAALEAAGVSTS
jgi:hypothetical protein